VNLIARKSALRKTASERRAALTSARRAAASETLAERFLAAVPVNAGAVVSGYWPVGDELDPRPLMNRLHATGHPLLLPIVRGRGRPLLFRRWNLGDTLVRGELGISIPSATAAEDVPELLIVPLVAYDRAGYRLGQGAGYYDLTIAALRASGKPVAAGVGFSAQAIEAAPREAHDQRLDWIVTEAEAIEIRAHDDATPERGDVRDEARDET
jgi:5-formyltetrahydrofolate cyclo-ligase